MKIFCLVLVVTLSLGVSTGVSAQGRPTLYGRITLQTGSGPVPLRGATIELIPAGTERVERGTYTDSFGNFAFYNVAAGKYRLKVTYAGRVVGGSVVDVYSQGTRVPNIVVRL